MMSNGPGTVWITGASSGIGRACAEIYAGKGAKVILSSRRENALRTVAQDISEKLDLNPEKTFDIAPLDLTDSNSFPLLVKNVLDRVGDIDIVVHWRLIDV